ncbi:MAG TPA: hypothetical protein VMR02_15380 [Terracidiphilus sp.]|jgi:hypothetical protein|nr:hypothetical protein [Terracidiphilus sp.]
MDTKRKDGIYLFVIGALVFVFLGSFLGIAMDWSMADFKQLYYAARCLHEHADPYNESAVLATYRRAGVDRIEGLTLANVMTIRNIYPPTQFIFTFPFRWLNFGSARLFWITLTLGSLLLASFLIWNISSAFSPVVSGVLIGFMLANSATLVGLGNAAGIAIGLCVVAAWCFLSGRYSVVGIVCLAFSLMLKPQDAAFVLLFFLLAGGIHRKHAIYSLFVAFAFGLPVVLWVTLISPEWPKELAANLAFFSARGGLSDPGPSSILWPTAMVNLQTVISLFDNDPHLYNLVTYTLCGALLLPWAYTTIRSKLSVQSAWIALAAISAITLLIDYHRRNDTKLLLLSVPACAMLFSQGGRKGRLALALTSTAFFFTGDIPWMIGIECLNSLQVHHKLLASYLQIPMCVLPAPLSLFAVGIFYVWIFIRTKAIPKAKQVSTLQLYPS